MAEAKHFDAAPSKKAMRVTSESCFQDDLNCFLHCFESLVSQLSHQSESYKSGLIHSIRGPKVVLYGSAFGLKIIQKFDSKLSNVIRFL